MILRRGLDLSQILFTESSKLIQKSRDTKNVINLLIEKYKNRPFFSESETFYVEFIGQSFVSQKYILQLYSPKFNNKLSLFEIYSFVHKKAFHSFRESPSYQRNRRNLNVQSRGHSMEQKIQISEGERVGNTLNKSEVHTDKKKSKQKKKKYN